MKSDLRKVSFTLCQQGLLPDLTPEEEKEHKELTRERKGLFHDLCKKEVKSPQSGNFIEVNYALVEDCETGKMHYVLPELITFIEKQL